MKRPPSLVTPLLLLSLLSPALGQTPQPTPAPQSQPPAGAAQQTPAAQKPTPTPTPQEESDEDVVRITSNLVQFDAVVTDKQGHLVTDLRPEDFEVYANDRKQEVTNFSFINAEPGTTPSAQPAPRPRNADRMTPPVPPARLKPGQVHRTVALVVDDLGTSFESLASVRKALKKFVDEQMQPGDLVAIMRTSAGMGALQQFTGDKRVLYSAIERVRWYPMGRAGIAAFSPMEPPALSLSANRGNPNGGGNGNSGGGDADKSTDPNADLEDLRDQIFTVGTLGAVNFIVRGMGELPGRKSIILFSDGLNILDPNDPSKRQRVVDSLRRLVDLANRAAVVVYTVDARGLPVLGLTAADNVGSRTPQQVQDQLTQRSNNYRDSQTGLAVLASQTGGLFIHDNNDLGGAVRRVLEDQRGYYLIGFRPDISVFERVRGRVHFNKLEVRLKRPGLKVRTRSGFIGVTDAEAKPVRHTRVEQLVGAITSPFASGDVPLQLTSLLGGDAKDGAFVTSLMHIDMGHVQFTDEPDGWHKAVLDVVALTFGEEGQLVDSLDRIETFRARNEAYDSIRRDGLVYTMRVPVKKPGAYQLRVAVRDAGTEKLGSASQFIEVPNLKKERLALSGIVMQSAAYSAAQAATQANAGALAEGQQQEQAADLAQGSPAVRHFRLGQQIDYYFNIYNARLDPAGRPQLQTQLRIFRDGNQVYAGQPSAFDAAKQADMRNLHTGTRVTLGGLAPGEYVLQVVVTDQLAPEKRRTATQWIDFEIVK
jgi:VWFA-related protein